MLRQFMIEHKLDAFIIPSTDAHAGEYVPDYWQSRSWLTGFDGSSGTAVVTLKRAALWTDSRYFIAATDALKDTGISLMKERVDGTPSITEWLKSELSSGNTVGVDGFVFSCSGAENIKNELAKNDIKFDWQYDPFSVIWEGRPPLPKDKMFIHDLKYAGRNATDKLETLRSFINNKGCDTILVSSLDDIAWLLNIRGTDVHCNPLVIAYCLVGKDFVSLYIDLEKIDVSVNKYFENLGIKLKTYNSIIDDLKRLDVETIMVSPDTNYSLFKIIESHLNYRFENSPISSMKSVKNRIEIEGLKNAMLRDGVAMVKFLRWLEEAVPQGGETELSVSEKLLSYRKEQALFKDISFDTISAYAYHGAIVHYEPTKETNIPIKSENFLLLDSGGQYLDGTTDITRTIYLGTKPSEEEKKIYTLVLKGHISLSCCKFPQGASGTQLDLSARYAMWQEGYNFGHGTGHGVGSYLCVHEGPHQIRMNYVPAPIIEGMLVTDEPGLYLEGKFGVRTENVLLCVPYKETDFGRFVGFEPMTLCPIDTKAIDKTIMSDFEINWLNDYHKKVFDCLSPLLTDDKDKEWLKEKTKNI